jgi:hypothetical protein
LPSPFPLAVVSQWYVNTRYPRFDDPPPTAAEALAAVAGFVSDVVRHSPPDGKDGAPSR